MKTTIVIPTYNEAENIELITKKIFQHLPSANILVVDDDSPDGTEKIAARLSSKNPNIELLSRRGKARSFAQSYIDGFKTALDNNADYIIQMDADFSHDPKYLLRMVEELRNHDMVVGSRYVGGGKIENWPFWRLLISRGGSFYSRIITGLPIMDPTAGFAGWRAPSLRKLDLNKINSDGYAFQIEMKFYAYKNNFKMKEIPIIFTDRRSGASKMNKKIVFEAILFCIKLMRLR